MHDLFYCSRKYQFTFASTRSPTSSINLFTYAYHPRILFNFQIMSLDRRLCQIMEIQDNWHIALYTVRDRDEQQNSIKSKDFKSKFLLLLPTVQSTVKSSKSGIMSPRVYIWKPKNLHPPDLETFVSRSLHPYTRSFWKSSFRRSQNHTFANSSERFNRCRFPCSRWFRRGSVNTGFSQMRAK